MKAAQIVAPRQIEIIDIDKPDISSDPEGTLLIKTHMNAICGTDMPSFAVEQPAEAYPLSPGMTIHECIGEVAESKSDRFKEGDAVLALPGRPGGLSEYFVASEAVTVPLVEFERKDCILMSQPLGTVIWACSKLGNLLNQDVVVMGQGPMGLLFTHLVSNLGAKTVIATDIVDFRLEAAKQMQATHTINAAEVDTVTAVDEITDGRMADLVFEVIGHQTETINQAMDLVKRDGTILAFGVPDDPTYPFRFGDLFRKNLRLIGSVGPDAQNNFPLAMDMIAQGRIDVSPMITHRLPYTEVQRGFELSLHKKDEAIKIVLEYD